MATKAVHVPYLGHRVVLVDRGMMRRPPEAKRLTLLPEVRAVLPTPPTQVDWSKRRQLKFPLYGNDQYGDCYYTAMCHVVQGWTGNVGAKAEFNESAIVSRYLKLAGGDVGLTDAKVIPEWHAGIVGPNGPYRILDEMTVPVNDPGAIRRALWYFGPLIYTAALPDAWLNPRPGQTWDRGTPDQSNGHAMVLSGDDTDGTLRVETWGIDPPVHLTPAGLESSDPEIIACWSMDWFDPKTGKAPNGFTYDELAGFWDAMGGGKVPPNPFVADPPPKPPEPPLPPVPPPVTPMTLTGYAQIPLLGKAPIYLTDGKAVVGAPAGVSIPPELWGLLFKYGRQVLPVVIAGVIAKKPWKSILADVLAAVAAGQLGS